MKRSLLVLGLLSVILFACTDRKKVVERKIIVNGSEITLSAISARDVDAGITGTPHAPIIIPYIKTEKSLVITLEMASNPLIIAEVHANMDELLSKGDLNDLLGSINILVSADKEHILYSRKRKEGDTCLLFHLLEKKAWFFTYAKCDAALQLDKLPSAGQIAQTRMADTSINDEESRNLFDAIAKLEPYGALDLKALENWNANYYARELVIDRCRDWTKAPKEWKKAVDHLFQNQAIIYNEKIPSKNSLAQIRSLCGLAEVIRDPVYIQQAHKAVIRGLGADKEYCDLFSMERSRYENDTIGAFEAMNTNFEKEVLFMLKNKPGTLLAGRYLDCASYRYDSIAIGKCMEVLADNWPADSIAREKLARRSTLIPVKKIPALKKAAEAQLNSVYSEEAKSLLQNICSCGELKALEKKHKVELLKPADCK